MPDIKPKPNRARYIETLRRMTPWQRLSISIELTEMTRRMLRHALRRRHPEADEARIHELFLERLARCHNRNY